MLHRADAAGLVVITQPAHAWVAGQLARAWGTARFPPPEPWEEVCVAAERHDDGWLAWEAAPTLNPATGRPFSFLELPRTEHLAIWSTAGPTVLALGRYPALLVSLHGTGLYERHDPARGPTDAGGAGVSGPGACLPGEAADRAPGGPTLCGPRRARRHCSQSTADRGLGCVVARDLRGAA